MARNVGFNVALLGLYFFLESGGGGGFFGGGGGGDGGGGGTFFVCGVFFFGVLPRPRPLSIPLRQLSRFSPSFPRNTRLQQKQAAAAAEEE